MTILLLYSLRTAHIQVNFVVVSKKGHNPIRRHHSLLARAQTPEHHVGHANFREDTYGQDHHAGR